ncbi:Txe/YoeB family addiction module toxin [Paraburkholderia caffeinilytica]|uniref:Txe/YoeB family addiction module toxin n=1 Tax=Paraburkholderia caffeinilytica TaxID=1761016 RepID=UPI0038B70E0F
MNKQKNRNEETARSNSVFAFSDEAWDDYLYWQKFDLKVLRTINTFLKECSRNPFSGSGQPEPLLGELAGYWSRRITTIDRLIYRPKDGLIYVAACRFHYDD